MKYEQVSETAASVYIIQQLSGNTLSSLRVANVQSNKYVWVSDVKRCKGFLRHGSPEAFEPPGNRDLANGPYGVTTHLAWGAQSMRHIICFSNLPHHHVKMARSDSISIICHESPHRTDEQSSFRVPVPRHKDFVECVVYIHHELLVRPDVELVHQRARHICISGNG